MPDPSSLPHLIPSLVLLIVAVLLGRIEEGSPATGSLGDWERGGHAGNDPTVALGEAKPGPERGRLAPR